MSFAELVRNHHAPRPERKLKRERPTDVPRKPDAQSRRVFRLLTAVHATTGPDGQVHLPMLDGTEAVGRLRGCSDRTVFLADRAPIPADQLRLP